MKRREIWDEFRNFVLHYHFACVFFFTFFITFTPFCAGVKCGTQRSIAPSWEKNLQYLRMQIFLFWSDWSFFKTLEFFWIWQCDHFWCIFFMIWSSFCNGSKNCFWLAEPTKSLNLRSNWHLFLCQCDICKKDLKKFITKDNSNCVRVAKHVYFSKYWKRSKLCWLNESSSHSWLAEVSNSVECGDMKLDYKPFKCSHKSRDVEFLSESTWSAYKYWSQ